eukprot:TRINITY_DN16211_c0_g1_i1.p1 TRINITY_DN16211_c0_g1~~TRINITY_DN16211_c0_g1_i1.p1  ORF type:complete len:629 (+),score=239.69 TRINITY_DN16211_c0_g1_i1:102-1988(+)
MATMNLDTEAKMQYARDHALHLVLDRLVGRLIEEQPDEPKAAVLRYLREEDASRRAAATPTAEDKETPQSRAAVPSPGPMFAECDILSSSIVIQSEGMRKMSKSALLAGGDDAGVRRGNMGVLLPADAEGPSNLMRKPSTARRQSTLGVAERDHVDRAAPLGMRGTGTDEGTSVITLSKRGSNAQQRQQAIMTPEAPYRRASAVSLGIEGAVNEASEYDDDEAEEAHCLCSEEAIRKVVHDNLFDEAWCEKAEFHPLFHECAVCNHRPAELLSLHSLKAYCKAHAVAQYEADERDQIFMAYDLTSYDKMFWCCKCDMNSYDNLDFTEAFIMALYETKGTYMQHVVTDMDVEVLENKHAVASCQGWRSTQEDGHIIGRMEVDGTYVGAVFDGHGGLLVAEWLARNFMKYVTPLFEGGFDGVTEETFKERISKAMVAADEGVQAAVEECGCIGATCCVVFATESTIYCANIGDSRAILQRGAGEGNEQTLALSHDHTLESEEEVSRVKAAGYAVTKGRIEGSLSVPRAFGDSDFKQCGGKSPAEQAVSVQPDVISYPRLPGDEFVLVACDGIWDGYDNEEAAQFVRARLSEGCATLDAAKKLILNNIPPEVDEEAIGTDNQTCLILRLNA